MIRLISTSTILTLLLLASACAQSYGPQSDKNTNWLRSCQDDSDCEQSECICGVCTLRCETDLDCEGSSGPSQCYGSETEMYRLICSDCNIEQVSGLCLSPCDADDDCDTEQRCVADACLSESHEIVGIIDEFPDPIDIPEPDTIIAGAFNPADLLGLWQEAEVPPYVYGKGDMKMQLVIQEAQDGKQLEGHLIFECDDSYFCESTDAPPEATDPEAGYPPIVDTRSERDLRNDYRQQFDYRIFDGRVDGSRFTFWFTNNDLWRQWCALQTPVPFDAGDRAEYSCSDDPQLLSRYESTDIHEKKALCASDQSVCHCRESGCTAQYNGSNRSFDLIFDGDVMQGVFHSRDMQTFPIRFVRTGSPVAESILAFRGVNSVIRIAPPDSDVYFDDWQRIDYWQRYAPRPGIVSERSETLFVGVWVGDTRELVACTGSHRVVVTLSPGETPGAMKGTVVFGDADQPPPASDPDIGYPTGGSERYIQCQQYRPTQGYTYTILEGHLSEQNRLRFRIAIPELYQDWCRIQAETFPIETAEGGYTCLPPLTGEQYTACRSLFESTADQSELTSDSLCPYDFAKALLCSRHATCSCFEEGCTVSLNKTLSFDLTIEENTMEGLVTRLSIDSIRPAEIRLYREPSSLADDER